MSGDLVADYAGLDASRSRLAAAGGTFTAAVGPLRAAADGGVSGAGEFGGDLADGAATFALSWSSALAFFAESAGLLGDNLGAAAVVLHGVDTELAGSAGPGRVRPE